MTLLSCVDEGVCPHHVHVQDVPQELQEAVSGESVFLDVQSDNSRRHT